VTTRGTERGALAALNANAFDGSLESIMPALVADVTVAFVFHRSVPFVGEQGTPAQNPLQP
jgi:hypothetical protein